MQTKSVLESKRSLFNYGSIIALTLTGLFADEEFRTLVKNDFGVGGMIALMVGGAAINQYLIQTSNKRPTFKMPEKKKPKDIVSKHDEVLNDVQDEFGA